MMRLTMNSCRPHCTARPTDPAMNLAGVPEGALAMGADLSLWHFIYGLAAAVVLMWQTEIIGRITLIRLLDQLIDSMPRLLKSIWAQP
jgi:hypothetical protein